MANVCMMDSTYNDLADRALRLLEESGRYRVIVLLMGAPGSGKTTLAKRVVDLLNQRHRDEGRRFDVDGTSYDRSEHHPHVLTQFNNDLPSFEPSASIDVENQAYLPTLERTDNGDVIIRGRGGDSTAIKIHNAAREDSDDDEDVFAQVIPMDGFHLPRAILSQFKDPVHAFKRRGSPFTFDSSLVVSLVQNLNKTLTVMANPSQLSPLDTLSWNPEIPDIYIPDFNHAEHDPNPFGCEIKSGSRILIMEGLYLLLNMHIWRDIPKTLNPDAQMPTEIHDMKNAINCPEYNDIKHIPITPRGKPFEFWKLVIDETKMLERVGKRHVNAGIVKTLEEGEARVKVNDLPNGTMIYKESFESDLNIFSIDDHNEIDQ